jgi:mono/diheme cytochrome c family protein
LPRKWEAGYKRSHLLLLDLCIGWLYNTHCCPAGVPRCASLPDYRMSPALRNRLLALAFIASSVGAGIVLSACDNGAAATPATPTPLSGEAVFARYCNVCHPGGGPGAGPSLLAPRPSDAELRHVVRNGKTRMPGFGPDAISDEQMDELVAYIHDMH